MNEITKNKNSILTIILISIYIMTFTVPFINGICGVYIRTGIMVLCIISALSNGGIISNEIGYIIFAFLLIDLLDIMNYAYMGYGVVDIISLLLCNLFDISLVFLAYWIIKTDNIQMAKVAVFITLFSLVITALTTYIGLSVDTEASRLLATIASSDDVYARQLGMKNIGGYSTIYYLVLAYPMIVAIKKYRHISTLVFTVITVIFFLCIVRAQYATALILFVISLILIFTKRSFNIKGIAAFGVVVLLSTLVFPKMYYDLFMAIANAVGEGALQERFTYLAKSFVSVDLGSDIDNRRIVLLRSITSFFQHPIIGNWLIYSKANGGHSYILDNLSKYGLLGIIGIVTLYKRIYRLFYTIFKNNKHYSFALWCFVETIILSTINTGRWIFIIGFFIPLSMYLIERSTEESL